MKYKHKCNSTKELLEKLDEVVKQIRDHHTILVDWEEVEIPEETTLKVRFSEEDSSRHLKFRIEWAVADPTKDGKLSGQL